MKIKELLPEAKCGVVRRGVKEGDGNRGGRDDTPKRSAAEQPVS
jgi:hypothetical protein